MTSLLDFEYFGILMTEMIGSLDMISDLPYFKNVDYEREMIQSSVNNSNVFHEHIRLARV